MNRAVFSFNEALDQAVLKPVATAYQAVVPEFVRTSVENFFDNFNDAWSAVNHLLQAKPAAALEMGLRFSVNTVFGLGFVNVAGAGIERRQEDFGQTLGRWGMPPGPFLVLPILGPSTLRDTAGADARHSSRARVVPRARGRALRVGHAARDQRARRACCLPPAPSTRSRSTSIRWFAMAIWPAAAIWSTTVTRPRNPRPTDNDATEGTAPK